MAPVDVSRSQVPLPSAALKLVWRIGCVFLTLLVLALLSGLAYEQVGRARDATQLPPRVGQAVDIGGRTLNLY